jgi:hypothetical protein
MGTIVEAQERVQKALDSFNVEKHVLEGGVEVTLQLDRYDYAVTHLNSEAKRLLSNSTEMFGAGVTTEEAVKDAIRAVRDTSEVGHIDFNIRVLEPRPPEFNRMRVLFDRPPGERVIPVRSEEARQAYLDEKTRLALETFMTYRIGPGDKLVRQFAALMARTKDRSPELLKTAIEYEQFNQFKKRRERMPVTLEGYSPNEAPQLENPGPETVDNSEFEATREQYARPMPFKLPQKMVATAPAPERTTELPYNAEFAVYCEELYEKTYGPVSA